MSRREYTEKLLITMAYQEFAKDLKSNTLGDAILLYGAEDFLINWALEKIITSNVEEEYRDLDVRIIDGENASAYDILSEARAYSMFSPKRVAVVKNYLPMYKRMTDPGMDELAEYVDEINKSGGDSPVVLVFALESMFSLSMTSYAKDLMKKCKCYEFGRLERHDLSAFINKRIRGAGKMLGSRELAHLIDVTGYYNRGSGYTLTHMDSDLSKLTGAAEGDTIDSHLIDEIMMGDADKFVFDLVDAMTSGNKSKSLEIAKTIIREEDGALPVIALLIKQFEIMYDALELSDRGLSMSQMAKNTGVNEYRFKKAFTAAMRYGTESIKDLLIALYEIDRLFKNGDIDRDTALELFVVKAAR